MIPRVGSAWDRAHPARSTMMFREMDMGFWLEQAEAALKQSD